MDVEPELIEPTLRSIWIDAVQAAGFDPRELPEEYQELCKKVFDFGAECGRLEYDVDHGPISKPQRYDAS